MMKEPNINITSGLFQGEKCYNGLYGKINVGLYTSQRTRGGLEAWLAKMTGTAPQDTQTIQCLNNMNPFIGHFNDDVESYLASSLAGEGELEVPANFRVGAHQELLGSTMSTAYRYDALQATCVGLHVL